MDLANKPLALLLRVMDAVENAPIHAGHVAGMLIGVIALRNLLEVAIAQNPMFRGLAAFVHYPLAYVGPFISLTLVLAFWGRVAPSRVARLMALAWLLTLTPPLFDLVLDRHPETPTIGYLEIDLVDLTFVFARFFDLRVALTGTTEGIRIETMAAVVLGAVYIALRSRSTVRAVLGAGSVYVVSLFWFTLPNLVLFVFQALLPNITRQVFLRGEGLVARPNPEASADAMATIWLVVVLAILGVLWTQLEKRDLGSAWFARGRTDHPMRLQNIEWFVALALLSGFNAAIWLRYIDAATIVVAPFDVMGPIGAALSAVLLIASVRSAGEGHVGVAVASLLLGSALAAALGDSVALGVVAASGLLFPALCQRFVPNSLQIALSGAGAALSSMVAFAAGYALVVGPHAFARLPPRLVFPWIGAGLFAGVAFAARDSQSTWRDTVLAGLIPIVAVMALGAPALIFVALPLGVFAGALVFFSRDDSRAAAALRASAVVVVGLCTLILLRAGLSNDEFRGPLAQRHRCVARLERIKAGEFLDAGQIDAAQTAYRAALECEPNDPESLRGLGIALFREGKVDRGLRMVEKASTLAPESARYLEDLGGLHLAAGNARAALDATERALAVEPRSLIALFNRARAFEDLGDPPKAIAAWEAYIERASGRVEHAKDVRDARARVRELRSGPALELHPRP